ncbi:hypothetical protein CDO52_17615 [Nocardiopsis gilva YIM 90087]|uniref:Uncharacterized protein n=1 Tax=Nocardiopsis gilva YIM 90087 TaxID=1235441 RepID=A0A223S8C7_9ACTN|nr:hypothetical protein [Nocardiopsis gilva]ASU84373.1 hypothetical protein CDO52_17615 [Nocardiopsis gilva YIM 90087]
MIAAVAGLAALVTVVGTGAATSEAERRETREITFTTDLLDLDVPEPIGAGSSITAHSPLRDESGERIGEGHGQALVTQISAEAPTESTVLGRSVYAIDGSGQIHTSWLTDLKGLQFQETEAVVVGGTGDFQEAEGSARLVPLDPPTDPTPTRYRWEFTLDLDSDVR